MAFNHFRKKDEWAVRPVIKQLRIIVGCVCLMVLLAGAAQAETRWPKMVLSKDGTPISYEVCGEGEPTLVFVHGWSCDARYWRAQIPYFSQKHRVVVLDLAGHGHSGLRRKRYTMRSFGEDVQAAVQAADAKRVILIGHSMGGSVIAEAARILPGNVIGLIGVDTLENIEYPMNREEFKKMMAPFRKNFRNGTRQFVGTMIYPDTDPQLREWIISDMSAAPPDVAMSAMQEMVKQFITGEAARVFKTVRVPVVCVNGSLWPVNYEANRRHMLSFDAIILPKADHFLMMDQPEAFNKALEKAVQMIVNK